jgi:HK97 family phage prohead protease
MAVNKKVMAYHQKAGFRAEVIESDQGNQKVIRGYPIVYGAVAKIPYLVNGQLEWWEEVVQKGALDGVDLSGLLFFQEHLPELLMGRNGVNMRAIPDDTGLFVEVILPETVPADNLYELTRLGILTDMSHYFLAEVKSDFEAKRDTIVKFKEIYEVSAVARGAYKEAIVMAYEPNTDPAGESRPMNFLL